MFRFGACSGCFIIIALVALFLGGLLVVIVLSMVAVTAVFDVVGGI